MTRGPQTLGENVGRVKSRMGACFPGSRAVFRGRNLHAEFAGSDWIDLYVFGITGRRFAAPQLRLLQTIWTYTSYPDARIWNNRVAALAGNTRSTGNMGVSAALAVSDAGIYGQGPCVRAHDFFTRARAALEAGADLDRFVREELAARRSLGGYGRPIVSGDERIEPIVGLARSLGLGDGPHLRLAFAVEKSLLAGRYRLHMNYAAVVAALAADLGLTAREFYLFMFPVFMAGMMPCYLEAVERTEGTLLPLPCTGVAYSGAPERKWKQP